MVSEPRSGWPYLFCSNCKRLTPVKETETGHIECMACEFVIVSESGGRVIYFTEDEARVRGLPIVKKK